MQVRIILVFTFWGQALHTAIKWTCLLIMFLNQTTIPLSSYYIITLIISSTNYFESSKYILQVYKIIKRHINDFNYHIYMELHIKTAHVMINLDVLDSINKYSKLGQFAQTRMVDIDRSI